jgi:hypothetical protein
MGILSVVGRAPSGNRSSKNLTGRRFSWIFAVLFIECFVDAERSERTLEVFQDVLWVQCKQLVELVWKRENVCVLFGMCVVGVAWSDFPTVRHRWATLFCVLAMVAGSRVLPLPPVSSSFFLFLSFSRV